MNSYGFLIQVGILKMEDFELVGTIVIALCLWSSTADGTNRTNVQPSTHLPENCPLFCTEWGSQKNSTIGPKPSITPCVSQSIVLLLSGAQICLRVYMWMNDSAQLRRGLNGVVANPTYNSAESLKNKKQHPISAFKSFFLSYFIYILFYRQFCIIFMKT